MRLPETFPAIEIRLLGAFEVTVDGAPIASGAWPQRRAADLVKLLALTAGHRLPRDQVLDALWPHLDQPAAAAALHKAAHYARRTLGADTVVVAGGVVALAPGARITTDVERFEAGEGDAPGELLPDDVYEEWTIGARERLRDLALTRLRDAERWAGVLALDPADEHAHRALMLERARAGDRAGAVRQFRRMTDALAQAGARPSAESVRLFRDVARGPAVVAARVDHEPLLGRPTEIAVVRDRIATAADGHGGVLLLTGPAGAGKTRLAEFVLACAEERRWHTLRGPLPAIAATLDAERPDLRAYVSEEAPVTELVAAAAAERGCAVLFDDLQDADEATIAALGHLGELAANRPLVVVAAWRGDGAPSQVRGTELPLLPVAAAGPPATRYAVTADGAHIAFQVVGDGPGPAVVVIPGWVSNVEQTWELPVARRMFQRLAARSRLVLWDKRGTGLSDPVAEAPGLDERMLDLSAVLDAADCERAVVVGVSEGGPLAVRLAVEQPERVAGLVLCNSAPRFHRADDWPFGWSPDTAAQLGERLEQHWGSGVLLSVWAPSLADDAASRELFGRFQRAGASPAMGKAMADAMGLIDVRDLLASVRVPTLIVHRSGDRLIPVEGSRFMAERIPGALLVEIPGVDHFPYFGDLDPFTDEVDEFLDRVVIPR